MKFILTFITVFNLFFLNSQTYYTFLDSSINAEINYVKIDSLNFINHEKKFLLDSVFNSISGKNYIYRWINRFNFEDKENKCVLNHKLIILQLNKKSKIMDGFYYVLEFPELPFNCMLYKIEPELVGQKIKKNKLKDLVFVRTSNLDNCIEVDKLNFKIYFDSNLSESFLIEM